MNKVIVTLASIFIIIVGIIAGIGIYNVQKEVGKKEVLNESKNTLSLSDTVTDECVEEWEEMGRNQNSINVNTAEEKLSPNASFIFQRHYLACDHTSNEYVNIPEETVNKTKEELQEKYSDWKIEKFAANDVILSKDFEGECGEHYILRSVDDTIVVFKIKNGIEEEYEKTDIATDYLTETDKISFKNGIKVYGKQNLSQILEDFE